MSVAKHRIDVGSDVSAFLAEHTERHIELDFVHDNVLIHTEIGHTENEALVAAETVLGVTDTSETVFTTLDTAA